jgi:hypothetical protein
MAATPNASVPGTEATPKMPQDRDKALKILAKSIFKELKSQGYESKHIVSLATELLAQITDDLQTDTAPR